MEELRGYYEYTLHPGRLNVFYTHIQRHRHYIPDPFPFDDLPGELQNKPKNLRNNYHKGRLSPTAMKKVNKAIDYMLFISSPKKLPGKFRGKEFMFKLNMLTVTLSSEQLHCDTEIQNEVLQPFLNKLRQKWHVKNYIWRAEKQGNGDIHYHIITDKFLPWFDIRQDWNNCQERLGYVSRYRAHMKEFHKYGFRYRPELSRKWNYKQQLKAYYEGVKNDWYTPNSTDIHCLIHVSNLKAYFKKYMTKSGQSSGLTCRLWGCSYSLSNLEGARGFAEGSTEDEIDKLMKDPRVNVYKSEYYTVLIFDPKILHILNCTNLLTDFHQYLMTKFPEYFPPV